MPTQREAVASYRAAISRSMEAGDEDRAAFLRGILDKLESKALTDRKRVNKVRSDFAKEAEENQAEAQERFVDQFTKLRQVEIENSMKGRMSLESAEAFFEEHQRAGLERSLKATYGLPE